MIYDTLKCRASRRFTSVELLSWVTTPRHVQFCLSEIEQESLTRLGKPFHTRGPATENALETMLELRPSKRYGMQGRHSPLSKAVCCWLACEAYQQGTKGGWPMSLASNVRHPILYVILSRTGSQCKSFKVGEISSNFRLPETTRAREFLILCRFAMFFAVVP